MRFSSKKSQQNFDFFSFDGLPKPEMAKPIVKPDIAKPAIANIGAIEL